MTDYKKQPLVIAAVVFLVIFALCPYSGFALVNLNGAGDGFDEGDPPAASTTRSNSYSIEGYIELGAGYYLQAKEDAGALLRMVELQTAEGLDIEELKQAADSALSNMNSALEAYEALVHKAESTAYNNGVIQTLNAFDYHGFAVSNGLDQTIFSDVGDYLGRGDITGTFKRMRSGCEEIRTLLNTVKNEVSTGVIPGVTVFWNINETFSHLSLFGSYVTRVFYDID
ncbi:MAG: hypothetical protein GY940_39980 [bacterium]|nr:hypothetical protein [bacterium]